MSKNWKVKIRLVNGIVEWHTVTAIDNGDNFVFITTDAGDEIWYAHHQIAELRIEKQRQ